MIGRELLWMAGERKPSDARTQGAPIVTAIGETEDAAARRLAAGGRRGNFRPVISPYAAVAAIP